MRCRWTWWCSWWICSTLLFGLVNSTYIHSSLKQNSLCDSDGSVSFTCITPGNRLKWNVSGDAIFFRVSEIGRVKRTNSHIAALIRHTSAEYTLMLNVVRLRSNSSMVRVECSNGSQTESVEFYNGYDPPSKPLNVSCSSSELLINGEQRILFTVSWLPNPSQSGNPVHYHVQLDDENPVVVQNTSVTLLANASLEMNHTVRVEAVDMCEDRSPPAVIVMRTRSDAVTSTGIGTVSEDTTPPPQTSYLISPVDGSSSKVSVSVFAAVVCAAIVVGVVFGIGGVALGKLIFAKFKRRECDVKGSEEKEKCAQS